MKVCWRCETEQSDVKPIAETDSFGQKMIDDRQNVQICSDCNKEIESIRTIPVEDCNTNKSN